MSTQVVDDLPTANAVGVTVEQAPAAETPSTPLEAQVDLT